MTEILREDGLDRNSPLNDLRVLSVGVRSEEENPNSKKTLAYILTVIDCSYKAIAREMMSLEKAWNTLMRTPQSECEVRIDAKLSRLSSMQLKKEQYFLEYSTRILGWLLELKIFGHVVLEIEQKEKRFRGLPGEYDVAARTIMSSFKHNYS